MVLRVLWERERKGWDSLLIYRLLLKGDGEKRGD